MRNSLLITEDGIELFGRVLLEGEEEPTITDDDDNEEEDDNDDDDENLDDDDEDPDKNKNKDDDDNLSRFSISDLKEKLKDNPELFKQARHAFFREQQFSEIFPTVEEAQRAADAQMAYEEITSAVVSGDVSKFLTELKGENPDGMKQFAENFLGSVQEMDADLFNEIVEPVVKQYLKQVLAFGRDTNRVKDEKKRNNIQAAAKIVRQVIFGGNFDDIEDDEMEGLIKKGKNKGKDDDQAVKQEQIVKYQTLHNEVGQLCISKLDEEIAKGLSDIVKDKPGLAKVLTKDIRTRVIEDMNKDQNYNARMTGLWKREERAGFNGTLKSSFAATYMAKARTLITKHRIEARKEALGKEDKGGTREGTRISGGRRDSGNSNKMNTERARSEGLSTKDIIAGGKR